MVPMHRLNDGRSIPQLGLGVWQIADEQTAEVVRAALALGYRSIDTAAIYHNEGGVGEGVRAGGVPREQLFITTKLWNSRQGYDETLAAFDKSLARLGLDYVDLYLIHWPLPSIDKYVATWRAFIRLRQEGRAKSIGVSNFQPAHIQRLIDETGVTPALNQVELHPLFQQRAVREYGRAHGVATESWSPLGQGRLADNEVLRAIAAAHGKTLAQVVLRWHLQNGLVVIPKSVAPARLRENIEVFDFSLTPEEMRSIAALDSGVRIGPDPDVYAQV
jgi:diketogulonate reductase-like aldo/keto reductase